MKLAAKTTTYCSSIYTVAFVCTLVCLPSITRGQAQQCKGTKKWFAGKCRYPDDIRQIKARERARKAREEALKRARERARKAREEKQKRISTIHFYGSPKGATVRMKGALGKPPHGGEWTCTIPCTKSGMKSGSYHVSISSDGYQTFSEWTWKTATQSLILAVNLQPPERCKDGMKETSSSPAFCIDRFDSYSKTKAIAVQICSAKGGKVCSVRQLDMAVQSSSIPTPDHELATTDSTGCCCPCGSWTGTAQHFWTPTGGAHGFSRGKCECWFEDRPGVKNYYRCCADTN